MRKASRRTGRAGCHRQQFFTIVREEADEQGRRDGDTTPPGQDTRAFPLLHRYGFTPRLMLPTTAGDSPVRQITTERRTVSRSRGSGALIATTPYRERVAQRRRSSGRTSASARGRYARRRRRRLARVDNDLTAAQWAELLSAWGGCAYCGSSTTPLQRDCIQPISRGGRYTLTNVVPACESCNASKHNDEVTGCLRRKRYDERAFLARHAEIMARLGPGPSTANRS